ncbi:lactoylglutathione lyase [Vibrio parahaemolyticus]|nr:lactoylglutathione lyase [Vibrio parahaemolyticus]
MPRGIFGMRLVFGGESGLREVGLCGIHPLTRRYTLIRAIKKEQGNESA